MVRVWNLWTCHPRVVVPSIREISGVVVWSQVQRLNLLRFDPRIKVLGVSGLCLRRMRGIVECHLHSHKHTICIPCGLYRRRQKQAFGNRTECTGFQVRIEVSIGPLWIREDGGEVQALESA